MNENEKSTIKPTTGWSQGDLPITVTYLSDAGHECRLLFSQPFIVGRDAVCDVCVDNKSVSRQHLRVFTESGHWCIKDLGSTNGTYIDDQVIKRQRITSPTTIILGSGGLKISLTPGAPADQQAPNPQYDDTCQTGQFDHTFGVGNAYYYGSHKDGDYSNIIQTASNQAGQKASRRYLAVVVGVGVLFFAALAIVLYR